MKLLLVINPASGSTDTESQLEGLKEILTASDHTFELFLTTGTDDLNKMINTIHSFQPDRVLACGGDGTVQLVANAILNTSVIMGIVPLGSANGLARALNIPRKPEDALVLILETTRTIPLDVLTVNNHICIHLADIGTNALLVKNYEEAGDKGLGGYAKHLLSSIRQSEHMTYTITTEEDVYEKSGYMLMIANANQYGTGVKISEGSVSDGKFEVCNVEEITLGAAIKAGLTALNVYVDKAMFNDVIRCSSARITINRAVHLQVDGEYIGETDELSVSINPAAVQIIVPA